MALMTDDHTFIESKDEAHQGRSRVVDGWNAIFASYPDYRSHFQFLRSTGDVVYVLGFSTGSYQALDSPAIWTKYDLPSAKA